MWSHTPHTQAYDKIPSSSHFFSSYGFSKPDFHAFNKTAMAKLCFGINFLDVLYSCMFFFFQVG